MIEESTISDLVIYDIRTYKLQSVQKTAKSQYDKESLSEQLALKLFYAHLF